MSNADINKEIEEIELHLNDMKQRRESRREQSERNVDAAEGMLQAEDVGDISDEELSALRAMFAEFDAEELIDTVSTHARAWLGTLNEDLRHTKPSTLLTVFGLGLIVGRLTK